jgi:hypothetical protein
LTGDDEKIKNVERRIAEEMGFAQTVPVSGQTLFPQGGCAGLKCFIGHRTDSGEIRQRYAPSAKL